MANAEDDMGKAIKLDRRDRRILELLDKNARLSIAEVSRKTGIQRDSVLYRINRLKKHKIIRFFHTILNPQFFGYPVAMFVSFILYNLSEEDEKAFLSFLNAHPNVIYAAKTMGRWDFLVHIVAKSYEHFDQIMRQIRIKFSNVIKEYETASVINEFKYERMVDLLK